MEKENNKLERLAFKLIRIIGIIAIIGGFLGEESLSHYNTLTVGHVVFISPVLIVEMLITIMFYRIFIRLLEKHIKITKRSL